MTPRTSRPKTKPVELFVSYSHSDVVWLERLRPLLKFDHCRDKAYVWDDRKMKAGDRWDKEIRKALERMDVFVGLVSYEFLASDYVRTVELKRAFAREKKEEIEIVPIVLYKTNLARECPELNAFSPLPDWDKCWRDYEKDGGHHQDAHMVIRDGLWDAIDKVIDRRR